MKREVASMLCTCLVLGLCGCGAEKEQSAAASTAGEISATEESGTVQEDELYLLSGETERGFYHMGEYQGNPRICFMDYESCEDIVLCSKPGCAHDTQSCMASPGEGKNIYFVYALRDGTLVYMESNEQVGVEGDQICLADADGSNHRVLATMQEQQGYPNLLCADRENLYLMQTDYENQQSQLIRVSLGDGTIEALWTMSNPDPQLLGTDGRNLIWESFSNNQEEIPPLTLTDDMTEEEVQQEEERYKAAMDAMVTEHRVYLLSVDTGEVQDLLTWSSLYGSQGKTVLLGHSRLYWVDCNEPGNLHWVSQDGGSGESAIDWPEEILTPQYTDDRIIYLEQMLGEEILLTVYGPWGKDLIKRYALEPGSGKLQEIPLQYISNASERPVSILGQTENALLVVFEEQPHTVEYIDPDGLPAQTLTFTYREGLISKDDFLAGIPNYQEIRLLES